MEDRFLKRLGKKAKKGMRGYPIASVAYYGRDESHASKVAVGILTSEDSGVEEMRKWIREDRDLRTDPETAREILDFIAEQGALTVVMSGRIIGCPHEEGIDYKGRWCPKCHYWKGRDRFTGELVGKDTLEKTLADLFLSMRDGQVE